MTSPDAPTAGPFATSNISSTVLPSSSCQNGTRFRNTTMEMATNVDNNNAANRAPRLPPSTDFGPQINLVIWFLTAVSSAFLALRVYCKFLRHRGLWWDDYLLIGSWVALVADCAFISACINLGFGRPFTQFNFNNLDIFLLYSNLAGSFSILAALWSKTSFAVTVLRISSGWTKAFVWFVIITVNACLGVAIVITWAQCTPIEKVWRPFLEGQCWPKEIQIRYNIFTAIYSGVMDIVLAVVPWKIIWSLTMNRKEKVGVMVAMSMGVFAGIISLAKTTQLPTISNATFTESTTQLILLGAAEPAITVVAASIPILRALVHDARPAGPPGSVRFYHSFRELRSLNNNSGGEGGGGGGGMVSVSGSHLRDGPGSGMYVGEVGGVGRSSTVVSSAGRYSRGRSVSVSSAASEWSREVQVHSRSYGRGHYRGKSSLGRGSVGESSRLSRLSRLSGLSGLSLMVGMSERGGGVTKHERSISGDTSGRGSSFIVDIPPTPPPGKIVATEEVVVEYEDRVYQRRGISEWPSVGRAI